MGSKSFVICDIEATGLDTDREPIEIALLTYDGEKIVDVYQTLINPLRTIPEFISHLTSISNRDLEAAPKFYEVADAIRLRLEGRVFVSHNTDFDLGLLQRKFKELGQELKLKSFCTLKIAQHEIPGLKNYNLDALCSFFGIKIKKAERHSALGDAGATYELFRELMKLREKTYVQIRHLPQHAKLIDKVPARPGLVSFIDSNSRVFRTEASFNMQKTVTELLTVSPQNRTLLETTDSLAAETTGSALIAEFKQAELSPKRYHWVVLEGERGGEKSFSIRPYKRGIKGLWYFKSFPEAKKKLRSLEQNLKDDVFAYREGKKSKEEIFKHNLKADHLSREAKFPTDNLVIVGDGRTLGEKSVVVIRDNHVAGYGYSFATEDELFSNPDRYIERRFDRKITVDLAAQRYIRVLKNLRNKTEGWRSLPSTSRSFHESQEL